MSKLGPSRSVHEFKCPDCSLSCQLIQEGARASMRHQKPTCKTYEATKKDGQKFLELAYIAYPIEKPKPVMVAMRDAPVKDEPAPPVLADAAELPPSLHRIPCVECGYVMNHAPECSRPEPAPPEPDEAPELSDEVPLADYQNADGQRLQPLPPRWQPLLESLSSELRALVYDRSRVSAELARGMANNAPILIGFDDTKIAAIAQAIIAVCSGSKGHP